MHLKTKLLGYQEVAVNKLNAHKVCALYMEQGTGKTRTILEIIKHKYDDKKIDKVLWICPISVKKTIEKEIDKHVDNMIPIVIVGAESISQSARIYSEIYAYVDERTYLAVDESNLVKNPKAVRTIRITKIADACLYKAILNGTPISRNEADLYAQWRILDWRILGYRSFWAFANNHVIWDKNRRGVIDKVDNVEYITNMIKPYSFQVSKEDVLDLPAKRYDTVKFELTREQDVAYEDAAMELLSMIDDAMPHTVYRMFSVLQTISSGDIVSVDRDKTTKLGRISPSDNPRLKTLLKYLEGNEEKVIIFCKYAEEIKEISSLLGAMSVVVDGSVSGKKRDKALNDFEGDKRYLITNKGVSSYGLNLQFCSNVIFYNNDWDLATKAQAEDRVHRIGQVNNVNITDIIASNTLEERVMKNLDGKSNLLDAIKRSIKEYRNEGI